MEIGKNLLAVTSGRNRKRMNRNAVSAKRTFRRKQLLAYLQKAT